MRRQYSQQNEDIGNKNIAWRCGPFSRSIKFHCCVPRSVSQRADNVWQRKHITRKIINQIETLQKISFTMTTKGKRSFLWSIRHTYQRQLTFQLKQSKKELDMGHPIISIGASFAEGGSQGDMRYRGKQMTTSF